MPVADIAEHEEDAQDDRNQQETEQQMLPEGLRLL
jgi:hypothetical protein